MKGGGFICPDPVSKENIQEFEYDVQRRIDPTIIPKKYIMNDLMKYKRYMRGINFLES